MLKINEQGPEFTAEAYFKGDAVRLSLADYRGKWVILFFYPGDFTFVCPTELGDMADNYEKFKAEGAEILSISTDTHFVHKAWHDCSKTINKIKFPMLADPTGKISRDYGVYIEEEGQSVRGTFLIDPDGVIKAFEVHEDAIGRSTDELLRKLQAAKFCREHHGEICPMNWRPGVKTLTRDLDLVGKI
jgi:peroxiredoxin